MAPINVCVLIRGELAIGRISSRRTLVFGRSVWILTMMQSCASAAKLRAAGPILSVGILCHVSCRFPPPRIVNRQSALNASASAEEVKDALFPEALASRTQDDALQCLASRD